MQDPRRHLARLAAHQPEVGHGGTVGQAFRQPAGGVAGDAVQADHQVGPAGRLAHPCRQVFAVDQHHVGAQRGQLVDQLRPAHDVDRADVAPPGQGDQRPADVGVGRVLDEPVARPQRVQVAQGEVGGEGVDDQRQLNRIALRCRIQARGLGDHMVAPATALERQIDPVAQADLAHRRADGDHAANALDPRHLGKGHGHVVQAFDLLHRAAGHVADHGALAGDVLQVAGVDRAGLHPDQRFVVGDRRRRLLDQFEHFLRHAEAMMKQRLHRFSFPVSWLVDRFMGIPAPPG